MNGDHMPYDLSATVHYKLTKSGNGHYTAISRSRDLQSQQWFMYDDDKVSSSNFTNRNTLVKKSYIKTGTLLFYVRSVHQSTHALTAQLLWALMSAHFSTSFFGDW